MSIKLIAPAGVGGVVMGRSGTNYTIGSDGTISGVSFLDVDALMNDGFQWAVTAQRVYSTPGAPAIAAAAVTVASTGFSNGTLSIAAQPDVPRQLQAVVNAGAASLVAGQLALTYTANDSTTQTDTLNFGGIASSGTATLQTSKGVVHLTSAVVSGVSGGSSPGVQVGTNGTIAVPVDPGFVDFAVIKETKLTPTAGTLGLMVPADETIGTVTAAGALIAPTQAPDGTHQLSFGYTYTFPG
jgi:hypothetical protein